MNIRTTCAVTMAVLTLGAASAFASSSSTADRFQESIIRLCKAIGGEYDTSCGVAYMPDKSCEYLGGAWDPAQGCLFARHIDGTPDPQLR